MTMSRCRRPVSFATRTPRPVRRRLYYTTSPVLVGEAKPNCWLGMDLVNPERSTQPWCGHINYEDSTQGVEHKACEEDIINGCRTYLNNSSVSKEISSGLGLGPGMSDMQKKKNYHSRLWIMPAGTTVEIRDDTNDDKFPIKRACVQFSSMPSQMWEFPVTGDIFHFFLTGEVLLSRDDPYEFCTENQERGDCFMRDDDCWYEVHSPVFDRGRGTWSNLNMQCFVFPVDPSRRGGSHTIVKRGSLRKAKFHIECDSELFCDFKHETHLAYRFNPNASFVGDPFYRTTLENFWVHHKLEVKRSDKAMRELIMQCEDESKAAEAKKINKKAKKKKKKEKKRSDTMPDVVPDTKPDAVPDIVPGTINAKPMVTPLVQRAFAMCIDFEPSNSKGDVQPSNADHFEDKVGCLEDTAPDGYLCPITLELMQDPVLAADGFTYERTGIEQWLLNGDYSPKTGEPLQHKGLTPNRVLRTLIRDFMKL